MDPPSPLPTAAVADACVRLQLPVRALGLHALSPGAVAGRVVPAQHAGSVDVFFEALQRAKVGDVLVIDNEGRMDEGCIGDLTALEAMHHGVQAIIVDGCHRDTAAVRALGLPVWSRGHFPFGPRVGRARAGDALARARVGGVDVGRDDVVVADEDGVVFVAAADAARVWELAGRIQAAEARQAQEAKGGLALCEQFEVPAFLQARAGDPSLTFRAHLRRIGKAIEE